MRKYLSMIAMILVTVMLAGCSGVNKDMWDAIKNVSSWEYVESAVTAEVKVVADGQTVAVKVDGKGYSDVKNLSGNFDMNIQESSTGINMPISIYMDHGKTYINKGFFTGIMTLVGEPVPSEIANLDAEYIAFSEMNTEVGALTAKLATPEAKQKMFAMYEELFDVSGVKLQVQKQGDSFVVKLNGNQMADMVVGLVKNADKAIDVVQKYLPEAIPADQVKSIKEEMKTTKITDKDIAELKAMFKDMSCEYILTPGKDTYTQEMKMNFGYDGAMLQMNFKDVETKVEPRELKAPGKLAEISMNALMEAEQNMLILDLTTGKDRINPSLVMKPIQKDGLVYVPFKDAMKYFGYEVSYDAKTKKVGYKDGEKLVTPKLFTKNGVAYISNKELIKYGYQVEINKEINCIVITK